MKSILMMLTLLATANAVSAQTVPDPQEYDVPYLPYPLQDVQAVQSAQPASDCPFAKAMQDANAAWQRLRAMCGAAKSAGCSEPSCGMSSVCKSGTGVAGCAKGCEAAQPPKTCCCAKACACCETCKTVKTQETVQAEPVLPSPLPCVPPLTAWKMPGGSGAVQIYAQATPAVAPPAVCYMAVSLAVKAAPAKLVTPDFEAHCDTMIQKGDSIQLIGNVLLLCKKHAQPLRIEGQRILLNLNDGSFVVETGAAAPRYAPPPVMVRPTSSLAAPPCMPSQCTGAMPERVEQTIRLRNVPAADLANSLEKYVAGVNAAYRTYGTASDSLETGPHLSVVADPVTNALLVKADPRELDKMLKIIGRLDKVGQCPSGSVCPTTTPASGVIEVVPVPLAPRPR